VKRGGGAGGARVARVAACRGKGKPMGGVREKGGGGGGGGGGDEEGNGGKWLPNGNATQVQATDICQQILNSP